MPKKSDRVYHQKLRRNGVVVDALRSGAFRVAFGSLIVECREEDLGPPRSTFSDDDDAPKKKKAPKAPVRAAMAMVDLHGMRVEEAVALVGARINDALLGGSSGIHIIHGLGTGKLKAAVHKYLASLSVVKRFQLEKGNAGTTVAYF